MKEKSKIQIETKVKRLIRYIEDIEKGMIQVPEFQRDLVWSNNDKLDLFESIKRDYPIGSILLWKPNKSFGESEQIGPYSISQRAENGVHKEYIYVLDGYQRLSTIFGCLLNPHKTKLKYDKKLLHKEFTIHYDLVTEEFFVPRSLRTVEDHQVPLYILMDTFDFLSYSQKLMKRDDASVLVDRARVLATKLVDYNLPQTQIIGGEIEEAVEIFSRVNSKGTPISDQWLVSALTYNKSEDFRLGTVIDELIEELSLYNFGKIKREWILHSIVHSFGKAYFDRLGDIEKLAKRKDFIEKTKNAIESIKKAVKFLFEELLVIDIKLLPYKNQLIFIADFFNQISLPTREQLNKMKEWFWVTTYSNYFTIYSLSKQREAYNVFQKYLRGDCLDPVYNDSPNQPFIVADFPSKVFLGSVRAKALILFLLNQSNEFKAIDTKKVDGLDLMYLFSLKESKHSSENPELVIPILEERFAEYEKAKNASFLLKNHRNGYEKKYFLTKEMSILFELKAFSKIAERRAKLIIAAEDRFIRKYELLTNNIDYIENDEMPF